MITAERKKTHTKNPEIAHLEMESLIACALYVNMVWVGKKVRILILSHSSLLASHPAAAPRYFGHVLMDSTH